MLAARRLCRSGAAGKIDAAAGNAGPPWIGGVGLDGGARTIDVRPKKGT